MKFNEKLDTFFIKLYEKFRYILIGYVGYLILLAVYDSIFYQREGNFSFYFDMLIAHAVACPAVWALLKVETKSQKFNAVQFDKFCFSILFFSSIVSLGTLIEFLFIKFSPGPFFFTMPIMPTIAVQSYRKKQ